MLQKMRTGPLVPGQGYTEDVPELHIPTDQCLANGLMRRPAKSVPVVYLGVSFGEITLLLPKSRRQKFRLQTFEKMLIPGSMLYHIENSKTRGQTV